MRRALFSREFRSALVPNLVTVGAILGALVVLERLLGPRLGKAEDIRVFTDAALLVGLVVSGFISGERCFPAEMKESRMLFLSSLPISRTWTWLAIVSARLLAALSSLAIVVAVRRPLLAFREDAHLLRLDLSLIATQALLAYILFFSAGTVFALLFRRTLFSYVAGFSVLGFLLIETLLASSYSTVSPQLLDLSIVFLTRFDGLPTPPFLAVFVSVLLFSLLFLSWRFYVQGEIGNPKRRIRNQLVFAMTVTAYIGFVFCIAASPRLASVGSTWVSRLPIDPYLVFVQGRPLSYGASPDGRYLFVFELMERRLFMVRVSIVDTRTGHVTSQSIYGGAGWGYWSAQGDVLNLLVLNNSPLDRWGYLIPGTVDWIRLSPEAREISTLRLKGVKQVEILAGGRALVVLREGDQGRVLLLDGASGRSTEMVRAPLDGEAVIHGSETAALVYFDNVLQPRRAWVIDSLAREVRVPRSTREVAYVLSGEVLGSPEAKAALLRRFGQPTVQGGMPIPGSFLLPDRDRAFLIKPEVTGLYFLEGKAPDSRVLWARPTASESRWEKLPDIAPDLLGMWEISSRALAPGLVNFIDPASGTCAFSSMDPGDPHWFVYDPQLADTLELKGCSPQEKASLKVDRVPGLKGMLIGLTCLEKGKSFKGRIYFFEHLPGSREMRTIKTVPARPSFGPPLYLDERGLEISISFDKQMEIWRSSPGMKDLRLWPPTGEAETRR